MVSKLWSRAGEREANRDLERSKHLADWGRLRAEFIGQLETLGQSPHLAIRRYELPSLAGRLCPVEHAWWPAGRVDEIERELFAADERRDVRGLHLHGGRPQGNAALATVRLLDRATEGGEEASLAMLVWALLRFREARSWISFVNWDLRSRARSAIMSVHSILPELEWTPGSKDLLPVPMPRDVAVNSLEELGVALANDAAGLIAEWVPVRIQDPNYTG